MKNSNAMKVNIENCVLELVEGDITEMQLIDPQHAGWGLNPNDLTRGVIGEMPV